MGWVPAPGGMSPTATLAGTSTRGLVAQRSEQSRGHRSGGGCLLRSRSSLVAPGWDVAPWEGAIGLPKPFWGAGSPCSAACLCQHGPGLRKRLSQ